MVQEAISTVQTVISPIAYIIIPFMIIAVGAIIFFIKKLKYNPKQILKSAIISLIISTILTFGFFLFSSLTAHVECLPGKPCPTGFQLFLNDIEDTIFPLILVFIIILLIYYIIQFVKKKT